MKGQLLGGRYQVVEVLASGGFSQTYMAEDIHRPGNPQCVVKHLLPNLANSKFLQNARRLFQAEAEILEKLGDYDQIPRLLAYFEEDREFYLVQEFIPGHILGAELLPDKPWTESQVNQLLQEVLEILVFVHSHGVIHRDIKPDNLIRRAGDKKLVLVDFGSVKQAWTQAIATTAQTSKIPSNHTIAIGTPGYMPTEQGRGKPQPNSDIYALGMIAIQALTLKNPTQLLDESENGEIVWQHLATVSDGLAAVLTKMVRYNHRNRYQSAAEALAALKQIRNSQFGTRNLGVKAGLQEYSVIKQMTQKNRLLQTRNSSRPLVSSPQNSSAIGTSSARQTLIPVKRTGWLGAAIAAALASIVAIIAIDWPLANTEKKLEQIPTPKAQGKEQCTKATDPPAQRYECQLAQAKKPAARNFEAAIAQAKAISVNSPVNPKAQNAIEQWQKEPNKNNAIARPSRRIARQATQPTSKRVTRPVTQTQVRTTPAKITRPVAKTTRTVAKPSSPTVTKRPSRTVAKPSSPTVVKKTIYTIPKRLPPSLTKLPVSTTSREISASITQRLAQIIYQQATRAITVGAKRESNRRVIRIYRRKTDKDFAQIKRKVEKIERSYRWLEKRGGKESRGDE